MLLSAKSHFQLSDCPPHVHLGKVAALNVACHLLQFLARLPSWQPCRHVEFAVLGKFSSSGMMLSCHSPFSSAFPNNLASLDKGSNRVAFCVGVALFVVLAPAQSQCCLQCIVINCVIILVVLLSVPLSPLRHHHSYGIVIAIAVGWRGCANCIAGSGPGNARPSGMASSLYLVLA